MKKILPLLIVLLVALFVSWPLLTPGFIPTHDGEYHLIRFYEFEKNLKAGSFFPRWAPGLDNGFGVPLFNFFYPLPNYLAEIWRIFGFSFIDSFKLVMASGIILVGVFFYLWIKRLFGTWPALVGAVFYVLAPYFLVDVYVRGSIGEVLALAFFPAVLWLVERKSLWAGFFLALVILSHNILALIFLPFLISYLFFRRVTIHYSLFTIIIGLGLSCFFWLPALAEAKYVTGLKMINFADHFPALFQLLLPSWGTGFSVPGIGDGMSFQVGMLHLLAVLISLIYFRKSAWIKFFLVWFLVTFFLLLEVSLPIWKVIPLMSFFQYPWRLLSLVVLISSFLTARLVFKKDKFFSLILIFLVFLPYGKYVRPVKYEARSDSFYLNNPAWADGTATLANSFNTIWAKPKLAKLIEEKLVVNQGETKIKVSKQTELQVNINYFPGWQVFASAKGGSAFGRNNQKLKIDYEKNGLINFELPVGEYQIRVEFQDTPIRKFANMISFLSLLFCLTTVIFKRRAYENKSSH